MRKSERILSKNDIPSDLSWQDREIIKNTTLLAHLIDNDLKHIWWWLRAVVFLLAGLIAKSFLGG